MDSQPRVELYTERLVLRPITQRDLPAVVAGCSNPLVARFIPLPEPYTDVEGREWIETAPERWQANAEVSFAVTRPGVGKCRGVATVRLRDGGSVGYWLAEGARGEGLMAEAVAALVRWAATEHGVRELILTTHPANRASQRTALNAGFCRAGMTTSARPYRDGQAESVLFRWTASSTTMPRLD